MANYKQRAGITDLSADAQQALQGNSEYEQKRADNTNQLRLVNDLRQYLENPANDDEVIPANVGLTDNGLVNIVNQYNEMMVERKRLLTTVLTLLLTGLKATKSSGMFRITYLL